MSLTDTLAQSIATIEGFFRPGTLAERNNNPGNLRSGPGQIGTSGGFAVFPDPQTGWDALYHQIALDAGRGQDLASFVNSYAPPSENNTSNYLSYLVSQLGVGADTLLADLGQGDPANPPTAPAPRRTPERQLTTPPNQCPDWIPSISAPGSPEEDRDC